MMIQLETGLHAIEIVEFDESEPATFLGIALFGGYADGGRGVLFEVFLDGFGCCCVGEVSFLFMLGFGFVWIGMGEVGGRGLG